MFISAIFLAGGRGTRMQANQPKQYLPLNGKAIALYSLEMLAKHPKIFEIIIVCEEEYRSHFNTTNHPNIKFAEPGTRRQDSLFNGLKHVSEMCHLVCVHDSARPFLSFEDLNEVLVQAEKFGAATLATPINNSIKKVCLETGFIQHSIDRETVWEMQTPQVAFLPLLQQGFLIANAKGLTVTDENALIELTGHNTKIVKANPRNFKITTPDDLKLAEFLTQVPHHV